LHQSTAPAGSADIGQGFSPARTRFLVVVLAYGLVDKFSKPFKITATQMTKRKSSESLKCVIKNYGLLWRKDYVLWGKQKDKGTLRGKAKGKSANFRTQIAVYVLYDEGRHPIYVGQTGRGKKRLLKRLNDHRRDNLAERWQFFSWFGLLNVTKNGELSKWDSKDKNASGTIASMLNEIEGVLIAATTPPFNKQGARFKHITKFKQVPDPGLKITTTSDLKKSIERLEGKIDKLSRRMV
jgi:hypothetical protein